MGTNYPLSLTISAFDKASGPLDRITAKLERFNQPFARLSASAARFGRRFSALSQESGLTKIGGALKGVGSSFGRVGSETFALGQKFAALSAVAGFTFFHFIKSGVDAGDVLAKTSDRLGVSIDYLAQMQFVAGRAGVSADELTQGFDRFNKALGQSKMHSGALFEALKHTPVAFQAQFKAAGTNEEKLRLMFVAMSRIPDASQRAAFAAEIFGKTVGPKMTAMVKDGIGSIDDLMAEQVRIAGSQANWARSSEILNDAMGDVGLALSGVSVAVMTELFPSLTELSGVVKEFLITNRKGIASWARETAAAISGWVRGGGINRLATSFQGFLKVVTPIVDKLGGWPLVLTGIATAITTGPLLGALGGLGMAIGTLGAAMLTSPIGWFLGGIALLAAGAVLVVKNWQPVSAFFKEWFPNLSASIAGVVEGINALIEGFGKARAAEKSWEMRKQLEQDALQEKPDSELGWWDRQLKWAGRNDHAGRAARAKQIGAGQNVGNEVRPAGAAPAWGAARAADSAPPQDDVGLSAWDREVKEWSARAPLNAGALRPSSAGAPAQAQVTIDVRGPPGTRVSESPKNTADLSTSLGITNQ